MARARPSAPRAASKPASKGKAKRAEEDDLLSDSDAEPDAFAAGKDRVAIDEGDDSGDDSDGLNEQGVYDLSSDEDDDDDEDDDEDEEDEDEDDDDLDEDIERGGEIGQRAFLFVCRGVVSARRRRRGVVAALTAKHTQTSPLPCPKHAYTHTTTTNTTTRSHTTVAKQAKFLERKLKVARGEADEFDRQDGAVDGRGYQKEGRAQ